MKTRFSCMLWALCAVAVLSPAAQADKTIAHISIRKEVREGASAFALFGDSQQTLREYLKRLSSAAKDANVAAVLITVDQPQMNWAQMIELSAAVDGVRKVGKPVWFYLEYADAAGYMLATSGDQIYLAPGGGLGLVGVEATMVFLKGLMDKIGVQADLVQVGKFKGAAEPFTRSEPSEELLGEINRLVDGLFDQMVTTVATNRRLERDNVKAAIDRGPFTAELALEAKLVDRVATRAQMLDDLQKKVGEDVTLTNNYGVSSGPKLDLSNPFELIKMLISDGAAGKTGNRIGLVYIDGMIVSGQSEDGLFGGRSIGSESIRKALDRALKDDGVRAVVVRIDSPGGSALASDVIWQAVHRFAQSKPVVVSVGGMAASGGYYIATAGQTILAEPASIVGSIGVVGGKVVLGGLFDKIGVNTRSVSRGAHAGMFNVTRPFTEAERNRVELLMEKTYQLFLERIRAGRGKKIDALDAVAQGRIFLGDVARNKGLVDRMGGLEDAVALAAGQAKIDTYKIEVIPPPKTLFDMIRDLFNGDGDNQLQAWQRSVLAGGDARLSLLAQLLPRQVRQMARQVALLQQLQREQVLTAWPVAFEVE